MKNAQICEDKVLLKSGNMLVFDIKFSILRK